MITLSNTDGKTIQRIASTLKAVKMQGLREINAVRQLQVISTKIRKQHESSK